MNEEELLEPEKERPPWWFVPAIWAGIAGAAGLLAAVIGAAVK